MILPRKPSSLLFKMNCRSPTETALMSSTDSQITCVDDVLIIDKRTHDVEVKIGDWVLI